MRTRKFHIVENPSDPLIGAWTLCSLPSYRRSFVDIGHMDRVADFCDPCYLAAQTIRAAASTRRKP